MYDFYLQINVASVNPRMINETIVKNSDTQDYFASVFFRFSHRDAKGNPLTVKIQRN